MRLGILTTSYPRHPGDLAGRFVAGFAASASAAGHEVEVVAMGRPAAPSSGAPVRWVRVGAHLFERSGGAPDALASGVRPWIEAGLAQAGLAAAARRAARRWDAVVSHWLVPSAVAGMLAARQRARLLAHLAIAHSSDVRLLVRLGWARAFARLAVRTRGLSFAFASGELLGRFARSAGPAGEILAGRSIVRPMGVDDDVTGLTTEERARARAALGDRAGDRLVVLALGRHVPVKGLDVLLEAAAHAARAGLALTLLLAGDGPERARLEAFVARARLDARFLGVVGPEGRREALAAADVLCMPSRRLPDGRTEGAPVAVLEGLAAGLPVVASRVGGIPELVADGETGILVPPGEPVALAAALGALRDPTLRGRLARAAERAGGAHRWSTVTTTLLAHLREHAHPGRTWC